MYEQEIAAKMAANKAENIRRFEESQDALYRGYPDCAVPLAVRARRALRAKTAQAAEQSKTVVVEVSAELPANQAQSINDDVIEAVRPENTVGEGWAEKISEWLSSSESSHTTAQILTDCLASDADDKALQMQVSDIMRNLGFQKKRESTNGAREYFWRKAG